jgi:D-aspartate ligase
MSQGQDKPGVVILGSDFKALGVVRSLGKKGIPSIVIDSQPRSAWFSRYVVKRLKWRGLMNDEAFLSFLLSAGKTYHLDGWILLPVQDEIVEFVARNVSQLSSIFQLVTQDWEVIRWANDKRLTYQLADQAGVPYPKTWYPSSEDDLKASGITFPAIIKPAVSFRFQYATRLKAIPVNNYDELLTHYHHVARLIGSDALMIQEIIPGGGQAQVSVGAYCQDGQMLLSMTARRTRQYPIDYGLSSSFVEAVEIPMITEYAEKLLKRMAVSGMVEVEFKYDARDSQYKVLDINVRPWGWHTLCIACGLDFPYIQYRDALGQPPDPIQPVYGHRWIRVMTDIFAHRQEAKAGTKAVGTYLRPFKGTTVYSVFDWSDPLPTFGDFFSAFFRLVRMKTHHE